MWIGNKFIIKMFSKTGFYSSRLYNHMCFLRHGCSSGNCLIYINDMKKISSPLPKEFWVPTGFFFQRRVAENSLSEPFKDIFTNHFKIGFLFRLLGLIFGFPSLLVPMLKSINLMAHTGNIRQYYRILRYTPSLLTISSLL